MTTILRPSGDLMLDIAAGLVPKHSAVNKFGRATDVDGAATDIWDRANAVDTQLIWVAPTQARIHTIVSTSASDDGAPVGVGARTVRAYGLTSWDTCETYEDVTLNGLTGVAMTTAMVIIHRMKVLTKGASGPNVGYITATAATDSTVTAQINPGEGQTQMAIYGIPSTCVAYMCSFYTTINKATIGVAAAELDATLKVNPTPDTELLSFLTKQTSGLMTTGASTHQHEYTPYLKIDGPAIMKIQAIGSTTGLDVSAGFDLILVRS